MWLGWVKGCGFSNARRQQTKISIEPILSLYYEESLVSSNLNSKQHRFHGAHPNIQITKDGWICHHDSMSFKVDFVCCIHLPLSALKDHPVIPDSIMKIQDTFPNIQIEDMVRLVPKTSPKFQRSCSYNMIQHGVYFILNLPNLK